MNKHYKYYERLFQKEKESLSCEMAIKLSIRFKEHTFKNMFLI